MQPWPYPKIVAHRGAGRLAPENTLAAIMHGYSLGQRMFEFDVKLSADGVAVLMHDAGLERTSNGSGLLGAYDWSVLSTLDAGSWHSPQYAGEPIPTLERVACWLLGKQLMANVEIKPSPGTEAHTGAAIADVCARLWHGAAVPCLLSSFSETALHAARLAAPTLPRALLMDRLTPDWLARCQALGCVAADWNAAVPNPALLRDAHAAGLRVLVYTVNDPPVARRLLAWGADAVITDAVDQLRPGDFGPA
jgi:glycerophosphoryl diester phosphodiesterase